MNNIPHGRDLSAEEMVRLLDEWANANNDKDKLGKFATHLVNGVHRTLQQSIMRLFVRCIEEWASTSHFDVRNEATVALARKIVAATGDKYDRVLPYI